MDLCKDGRSIKYDYVKVDVEKYVKYKRALFNMRTRRFNLWNSPNIGTLTEFLNDILNLLECAQYKDAKHFVVLKTT